MIWDVRFCLELKRCLLCVMLLSRVEMSFLGFQLIRIWIRRISAVRVYVPETMFAIRFLPILRQSKHGKWLQLKASVCWLRNPIKLIYLKMNLVEKWQTDSFTKCADVHIHLPYSNAWANHVQNINVLWSLLFTSSRTYLHIFVVTTHFHIQISTGKCRCIAGICARVCLFSVSIYLLALICLCGKCLLCTCKGMETFVCFPWIFRL